MNFERPPAVAGTFYPSDARVLRAEIERHLAAASQAAPETAGPPPKALIAPHAGYRYSGPIAGQAYARVRGAPTKEGASLGSRGRITRVVLLGPAHRVRVRGLATSTASAFVTPLGKVRVDRDAVASIEALPFVTPSDRAHEEEHSLEVHLPFLQVVLGDVAVVPIVVGDATPDQVAEVLERLWGGPETLVVVSSDLSHYLDDAAAKQLDAQTCRAIESLSVEGVGDEQACGRMPVRGLLALAKRRNMSVQTLDLRNSGDTSGRRDWVVGYGAWAFS